MSTERRDQAADRSGSSEQPQPAAGAKKGLRRLILWIFCLFLPVLLLGVGGFSSCVTGSPFYLWNAAAGQWQIICNRRPIVEVLEDPELDAETRKKLELVLEVQSFARDSLGLSTGDSYRYFSRIDRDAAAYNVIAAPALSLEAHSYWFPIVGTVPYLGFFSRDEAEEHARDLEEKGLDVLMQDVAGYSTLGWFDDPLLSSQLRYSEYGLVRLVIHEAVHATVWIPGSVRFNESLASFVEEEGARQFIRRNDPDGSRMARLDAIKKEQAMFRTIMHRTATELKQLYSGELSNDEKLKSKHRIIEKMKESMLAEPFVYLDRAKLAEKTYNNAHFMSYLAYNSGTHYFQSAFRACNSEWNCFLQTMKGLDRVPEDWN